MKFKIEKETQSNKITTLEDDESTVVTSQYNTVCKMSSDNDALFLTLGDGGNFRINNWQDVIEPAGATDIENLKELLEPILVFKNGGGVGGVSGLDGYIQFATAGEHDSEALLSYIKGDDQLKIPRLAMNPLPSSVYSGYEFDEKAEIQSVNADSVQVLSLTSLNNNEGISIFAHFRAVNNANNEAAGSWHFIEFKKSSDTVTQVGVGQSLLNGYRDQNEYDSEITTDGTDIIFTGFQPNPATINWTVRYNTFITHSSI